jgi:transcriptional regulator with XRE-family HTH domain
MTPLKNNLRKLRDLRDLSQEQLAKRAGTTAAQIDRLEKSQRKLTIEWLLRLCSALAVTADQIVDLPLPKVDSKKDKNKLGEVIGCVIETVGTYHIDVRAQTMGAWTVLIYEAIKDKHLTGEDARSFATGFVLTRKALLDDRSKTKERIKPFLKRKEGSLRQSPKKE